MPPFNQDSQAGKLEKNSSPEAIEAALTALQQEGKLTRLSFSDALDAQNSFQRENDAPEIMPGDIDLMPGEYSSNNGIWLVRYGADAYIGVGLSSSELDKAGLKRNQGGTVFFSNGVSNKAPDVIKDAIINGRKRVEQEKAAQDSKYAV